MQCDTIILCKILITVLLIFVALCMKFNSRLILELELSFALALYSQNAEFKANT